MKTFFNTLLGQILFNPWVWIMLIFCAVVLLAYVLWLVVSTTFSFCFRSRRHD